MLKHEVFRASTNEEDSKKYIDLLDFVQSKINKWLQDNQRSAEDIISLETSYSSQGMGSVQGNSSTFHSVRSVKVIVWYRM